MLERASRLCEDAESIVVIADARVNQVALQESAVVVLQILSPCGVVVVVPAKTCFAADRCMRVERERDVLERIERPMPVRRTEAAVVLVVPQRLDARRAIVRPRVRADGEDQPRGRAVRRPTPSHRQCGPSPLGFALAWC